jgi:predicted nucleotidyltransferase
MNNEIELFLQELVSRYNCVSEIWFFGSRANETAVTDNSDWDFLIFGNEAALSAIKKDEELSIKAKNLIIGLLIEQEGNKFLSPWKHKDRSEKLTLEELHWKIVKEGIAEYIGYSKDEFENDISQHKPDWMIPRNKEEEMLMKNTEIGWPMPVRRKAFRIWSAQKQNQIYLNKII